MDTLGKDNRQAVFLYAFTDTGEPKKVNCDDFGNMLSIGTVHNHVHEGRSFVASRDTGDIADDVADVMLIQVGSNSLHFMFSTGCTGAFLAQIYEGPTWSAAGTAISIHNKNRTSAKTSDTTFSHTPTTSGNGTLIQFMLVSGGKKAGSSEELGENDQYVLAPNTDYLLRMTNISGGSARSVINFSYYEPAL